MPKGLFSIILKIIKKLCFFFFLFSFKFVQVYHVQEGINNKQLFFDEDLDDHQPFPTLQHALAILDPNVGFNIEIKWTMLLKVCNNVCI